MKEPKANKSVICSETGVKLPPLPPKRIITYNSVVLDLFLHMCVGLNNILKGVKGKIKLFLK